MDIPRKIGDNGTIYLNPEQLHWLGGMKPGEILIIRDETHKKYGRYISIFKPKLEEHVRLAAAEKNNNK